MFHVYGGGCWSLHQEAFYRYSQNPPDIRWRQMPESLCMLATGKAGLLHFNQEDVSKLSAHPALGTCTPRKTNTYLRTTHPLPSLRHELLNGSSDISDQIRPEILTPAWGGVGEGQPQPGASSILGDHSSGHRSSPRLHRALAVSQGSRPSRVFVVWNFLDKGESCGSDRHWVRPLGICRFILFYKIRLT